MRPPTWFNSTPTTTASTSTPPPLAWVRSPSSTSRHPPLPSSCAPQTHPSSGAGHSMRRVESSSCSTARTRRSRCTTSPTTPWNLSTAHPSIRADYPQENSWAFQLRRQRRSVVRASSRGEPKATSRAIAYATMTSSRVTVRRTATVPAQQPWRACRTPSTSAKSSVTDTYRCSLATTPPRSVDGPGPPGRWCVFGSNRPWRGHGLRRGPRPER